MELLDSSCESTRKWKSWRPLAFGTSTGKASCGCSLRPLCSDFGGDYVHPFTYCPLCVLIKQGLSSFTAFTTWTSAIATNLWPILGCQQDCNTSEASASTGIQFDSKRLVHHDDHCLSWETLTNCFSKFAVKAWNMHAPCNLVMLSFDDSLEPGHLRNQLWVYEGGRFHTSSDIAREDHANLPKKSGNMGNLTCTPHPGFLIRCHKLQSNMFCMKHCNSFGSTKTAWSLTSVLTNAHLTKEMDTAAALFTRLFLSNAGPPFGESVLRFKCHWLFQTSNAAPWHMYKLASSIRFFPQAIYEEV